MKFDDVLSQKELEQSAQFMQVALKAKSHLKFGESCTFTCPICGATVKAERSNFNGHLHTHCSNCGALMDGRP